MTKSRTVLGSVAVLLWCLSLCAAGTTPQKRQRAREIFDKAETKRAALEAKAPESRKLAEYQSLLQSYDTVVHLAPTIRQAPESVFRGAQLNRDMAELFAGDKRAAGCAAEARRLSEFLIKEYPQHHFVPEARKLLAELDKPAPEKPVVEKAAKAAPRAAAEKNAELEPSDRQQSAQALQSQAPASAHKKLVQVTGFRQWKTPTYTRVVIDLDDEVQFETGRITNPERIYFDLHDCRISSAVTNRNLENTEDGLLKRVRLGLNKVGVTRVVLEIGQIATYSAFLLPNPYRMVIDIQGAKPELTVSKAEPAKGEAATAKVETPKVEAPAPEPAKKESPKTEFSRVEPIKPEPKAETPKAEVAKSETPPKKAAGKPAKEAEKVAEPEKPVESASESKPPARGTERGEEQPATKGPTSKPVFDPGRTAAVAPPPKRDGNRTLTRALGLKIGRIVIDPGHGGHDTGTIGPSGLMEKDLVLDVAQRLGTLVQDRLGGEVVFTRDDDTFIPLETRTAIANQKQADLFISIHANSSRDPKARGIETYYLSFTTSQDALEVAARENAVSEKSVHELQDLVRKITLYEKVGESKEFAAEVQKSLYSGMARNNAALRNRGVKKAPFVVLIGANMPSVLAEISFVSNPTDEKMLKKPDYRQRVAESLFKGVQRYAASLGGVKVASQAERPIE